MRESRDYRNIALVGFMGTGKSTVGQLVAGMLHFRFLDTDERIETVTQRRIADIFANEGETEFRKYEKEMLDQITTLSNTVVSTGGGLITVGDNLAILKQHAL